MEGCSLAAPSPDGSVHPITSALCTYLAKATRRKLPRRVAAKAKTHVVDTIAAMIAGSQLIAGHQAIRFIETQGGAPEAMAIGSSILTTAANAALVNGMHAHADETDDSHPATITHPGCAVVPAALATAECFAQSGTAFLRAVVLGYDLCARIVRALGAERMIAQGRSTHALGGAFGAAAAAGALAGLDRRQMAYLLTYTVQQAAGTMAWLGDRGHIAKAFDFGGMPARNGTLAAVMVRSGMTAAEEPLFCRRGFFDAFGPAEDPDALVDGLGTKFEILETNIKRWAVGSPNQSVLDALEQLRRRQTLDIAAVESVDVEIQADAVPIVDNRAMPNVCLQHLVALMLVDGTVSYAAAHDHRRMADKSIIAARRLVRLFPSLDLQKASPQRQAIVTIRFKSGEALTERIVAVRGSVDNPMRFDEVETKALDLMTPIMGAKRSKRLLEALSDIESVADMRDQRPLLRAAVRRQPASTHR
jgi:2-methylcitrate dehydratase PrpD